LQPTVAYIDLRQTTSVELASIIIKKLGAGPHGLHIHTWPAAYSGKVWIRILPTGETAGKNHDIKLRWGPWRMDINEPVGDSGLALSTSKGADDSSTPCQVQVIPAARVLFGVGDALNGDVLDIGAGWTHTPGQPSDLPQPRAVSSAAYPRRVYASVQTPIDLISIPAGNVYISQNWKWPAVMDENSMLMTLEGFLISRFPITCRQYRAFTESSDGLTNTEWRDPGPVFDQIDWEMTQLRSRSGSDDTPALVTRYEAVAYCRWLTSRVGTRFTIPTEPHWVRAARGDSLQRFPWGDLFDPERCSCAGSERYDVTPVDRFPSGASKYGVIDMIGNTPEWIALVGTHGADAALAGTDQGHSCENSAVIHDRGVWSCEQDPAKYSCDYRGESYPPLPDTCSSFRICTPSSEA
jgi:formylglycine-generating enzyme required for sulfatase activity